MSWIGGSLSSITGQLSNLTKDILTEGTEEVSDHATELKIAQDKITESDNIISSQKVETDRLKRIIRELEEKAESAELQINSISREYRTLLLEKEKEINALKQTQSEAFQHHQLSTGYSDDTHSSHPSNSGYHGGFASTDDLDFGDNITMQHEINKLTQEIQRLRSEVKHWKSAASQQNQGLQSQQDLDVQQVIELKNHLKELEEQLRSNKENHQHEVVSLQDVHQHKLSALRQKHRSEVEQYQQTIQELQQGAVTRFSDEDTQSHSEIQELKSTLQHVQEELEKLQSEKQEQLATITDLKQQLAQCQTDLQIEKDSNTTLQQQIQDDSEKMKSLQKEYEKAQALELLGDLQEVRRQMSCEARTVRQKSSQEKQDLVNQIIESGNKQRHLRDSVEVLQEEQEAVTAEAEKMVTDLGHMEHQQLTAGIMDTIEKENLILRKKMVEQQEQITLLEKALQTVTQERQRTDNTESLSEQLSVTSDLSELSLRNKQLDEQVVLLRQQIEQYEQDIEQFEVIKSDWQTEKEALEDVLMDLREQLREKETALNIVEAQKGLVEVERQGRSSEKNNQTDDMPPDVLPDKCMDRESDLNDKGQVFHNSDSDDSTGDICMDIEAFSHKLELLTQANAQLEYERDQLLHNKRKEAQPDILSLQKQLQEKDSIIAELTEDKEKLELHLDEQSNELHQQLKDKETIIASIQNDKDKLELSAGQVSQLTVQLETSVLHNKELQQQLEEKHKEVESLGSQLNTEQVSQLENELEVTQTDLQTKELELAEIQVEKQELETSLIELDTQHQEAMDQLIQIRNGLSQQLEEVNGQLKDAFIQLKEQSDAMKQQTKDAAEKNRLIQNLEEELSRLKSTGGTDSTGEGNPSQNGKDELIQLVMETRSQLQEKEVAVSSLEEQIEDLDVLSQEKDKQIHSLQQQLASLREWNDQTEEEVELSDIKDKNVALEQEIEKYKQSVSDLQCHCDKKDSELKDMKQKLQSGAIAINDLHMDIKDLEDSLKRGEKSVAEKVDKIKDLRTANEELRQKMNEIESKSERLWKSNDELQQRLAASNKETEVYQSSEQLSAVQYELVECQNKLSEADKKNVELTQKTDNLTLNLTGVENSNSELTQRLSESEKCFHELKESSGEHIKHLQNDLQALMSEKVSAIENFTKNEELLQTRIKQLESNVDELYQKEELNTSSAEEKCQVLTQRLCDRDACISKLEIDLQHMTSDNKTLQRLCDEKDTAYNTVQNELTAFKSEAESLRQSLDAAVTRENELSEQLSEREQNLSEAQHRNTEFQNLLHSYKQELDEHQLVLDNVTALEQQCNVLKEQNQSLKQKLTSCASMEESEPKEDTQVLGAGTAEEKNSDLEAEVGSKVESQLSNHVIELEEQISQYKSMMAAYDEDIAKLNHRIEDQVRTLQDQDKEIIDQDEQIAKLRQSSEEKQEEMINLRQQLHEIKYSGKRSGNSGSEKEEIYEDIIEKSIGTFTNVMQNGELDIIDSNKESVSNVLEEMEHLQNLIHEKDKVIKELQGNNSSLLKMLEGKGGNSNLLDIHRLEGEVRSLKLEREQMMAVMNEKSRECSSLKSEVHRLMNIISAEKVALQKLQTDNQELMQRRESPERDDDMQREALQTLSRLVRDKDIEIQALTQKNQTLLQVLQETSSDGASVSGLVQDKDNLMKQVTTLQSEKQQMMTYLSQKHQESVTYHAEIQRLTAYITTEAEKHSKILHDFDSLKPQFEDNKQALLKAQNELINYKQKYTELEVKHGELLQRSNATETIDLTSYNCKLEEVKSLQEKHKEFLDSLREKDAKIQSLRQQSMELEESLVGKEGEVTSLKKQIDSLTFQNQGLQTELGDLSTERSSSQQQIGEQETQVHLLKEANDQLMLKLQEKDFELKSLQEKTQTLTAILQDQQQGEEGHKSQVEKLMQENEYILSQAKQLQQERDQAMLSVKQRQTETQDLIKEIQTLKDREVKAHRELDRLRTHLLQIEEGYTKEALEAEEREKDLRNRLVMAEEKLITSTSAVQTASQNASLQVESLQQQLISMAAQRDQAYLQISSLQDQCQQYSVSLANLQMVLEQFQKDKESQVATETEKYQRQNVLLEKQVAELENSHQIIKEKLEEAEDGLEAAARLSEQVDRKEEALSALKEEVLLRENALKAAEEEIHKLTCVHDAKVDKLVIKNLFLGYFTTAKSQQQEVLRAIGGVLHFTQEDFDKISNPGGRSWMPGFLRFGSTPTPHHSPMSTPARTPRSSIQGTPHLDKSFSELFVKFLEKESSPPPPAVRLPAEEMVADIQRQKEKPAYNPFTAPRHVAMPVHVGESSTKGNDSHIFMSTAPMSPTLPMFTPVTADHSGHSQPSASSSAILKDVLSSR